MGLTRDEGTSAGLLSLAGLGWLPHLEKLFQIAARAVFHHQVRGAGVLEGSYKADDILTGLNPCQAVHLPEELARCPSASLLRSHLAQHLYQRNDWQVSANCCELGDWHALYASRGSRGVPSQFCQRGLLLHFSCKNG